MNSKYKHHPIANIFPMMDDAALKLLGEDVKKNGLQETIILLIDDADGERKILDGRNREKACFIGGTEPRYANFEDLSPAIREAGPTAFVMGRNLHRRHLTPSQRAAVAAESLPFFEAEAAKRRAATQKQNKAPGAPSGAGGETAEVGGKGKKGAGKASAQAGKAAGVSARSVERAKNLKKKDPKKFEQVKQGGATLGGATRDEAAEQAKKAAATEAGKALSQYDNIKTMLDRAAAAGGKLVAQFDDFTVTVTKKGARAPRASQSGAKKVQARKTREPKAAKKSAKKAAKKAKK